MNRRPASTTNGARFARWAGAMAIFASCFPVLGCGNYSNEDLFFLEALPEEADLQASIPRQGAVTLNADDWYRTTKALIAIFNGAVDSALALVSAIRHEYPTARFEHGRIWGPYRADDKPGWFWMMVMRQQNPGASDTSFSYRLGFVPTAHSTEADLVEVLHGSFSPSATTRGGHGEIAFNTVAARKAGVPFKDDDNLASLSGTYVNDGWPKAIDLTWVPLIANPPPARDPNGAGDPSTAHYSYQLDQSGQGVVTYTFDDAGNPAFIPGTSGVDTLQVVSRWKATGTGRADAKIVSGDFTGATLTHCWDDSLQTSYKADLSLTGLPTGELAGCPYQDPPAGF